MASKKAQKANSKQAQNAVPGSGPSVQIHTYVMDTNKSIDELLQAGRDGKIYERKPNKSKLPPSFFHPRMVRHRGSSAGHSPQGSVDDGFSTSRTTLSPSSLASLQSNPVTPFHKKQASAPELDNRNALMYSRPSVPVANHSHSKSVSAIPVGEATGEFPQHFRSASHDHQTFQQRNFVDPSPRAEFYDPRGKSQSLDPMLVSTQEQQMRQSEPIGDPLPPGWGAAYDANGDVYFIDTVNKRTTWYDPRISEDAQHARIRARHGIDQQHSQPTYGAYMMPDYETNNFQQRVQQLENERASMQEKREQLFRAGLLDPGTQSYNAVSPMLHQTPNIGHVEQYYHMGGAQVSYHNRTISNDSAVDQGMEVDYAPPHQTGYNIDPTLTDINPHEFDKYLHLSDRQPAVSPISRFQ